MAENNEPRPIDRAYTINLAAAQTIKLVGPTTALQDLILDPPRMIAGERVL